MKWRTILVLFLVILSIFTIYILNIDRDVYYVDINNLSYENDMYDKYILDYLNSTKKLEKYIKIKESDYRITDLIRDINENKLISDTQTIQNALIKADLLTIKMGDNELNYKIDTTEINELFDYCDTLLKDVENLFNLLRKYCKEDIYFLGLYNTRSDYYDEIYNYLNLRIEDLCNDFNIHFISANNLKEEDENIRISENIIETEIFD